MPPLLLGFGPTELWVIVGVIVLLFGAAKIPDIARAMGRAKGEFKRGLKDGDSVQNEDEEPAEDKAKKVA